ncbi:RDD family protein [Arsenicicoccus cauae]|uniref:DUF2510 domain-containing protein n=1 Tax=Arsenicicoccus cauae TaxID=2663847 RepID=A0A6I3IBQ8_9MICO|nr:RDD family protein [Arsenicicoccus cauae]MTB71312.1 DUF2510 domain-containing protein [Arsenicicoccus cauae]
MTQPSGWYDDPQDPAYLRYFDGVSWSDHRAPKVAPQVARSQIGEGAQVEDFHPRDQQRDQQAREGRSGQARDGGQGRSPYVAPPGGIGGSGTARGPRQHQQAPYPGAYAQPAQDTTPDGQPLSGWWRRFLAWILDGLLVLLVMLPLTTYLMRDWIPQVQSWWDEAMAAAAAGSATLPPTPMPSAALQLQVAGAMFVAAVLYEVVCLSRWGRTLGRLATGISVRSIDQAAPAPAGQIALRTIVKRLGDILPGAIGTVWMLVDGLWPLADRPLHQAIHDKVGRTCVVRGALPRRRG